MIEYCEDKYTDQRLIKELKTLLLGDVDTEPKLVIGGKFGYAEFRWVKKVVAIPYLPEKIIEGNRREWLFCEQPQEKTLEAAPAPTLLAGFPDVEYPKDMEHYQCAPAYRLAEYRGGKHNQYSYSRKRLDNGYGRI